MNKKIYVMLVSIMAVVLMNGVSVLADNEPNPSPTPTPTPEIVPYSSACFLPNCQPTY